MRVGRSCFTLSRLRSRVETAGKMKISRIELASRPKTFPVVDHHPSIPQRDQTVVAKRFEASIHVHGTETEGITKFSLGDRKFVATVVCKPHRLQAKKHLAEEVGDPLVSRPPTDAHHPFPEHCRIDQRALPERSGDARVTLSNLEKRGIDFV